MKALRLGQWDLPHLMAQSKRICWVTPLNFLIHKLQQTENKNDTYKTGPRNFDNLVRTVFFGNSFRTDRHFIFPAYIRFLLLRKNRAFPHDTFGI
jgi:hypothetical protein